MEQRGQGADSSLEKPTRAWSRWLGALEERQFPIRYSAPRVRDSHQGSTRRSRVLELRSGASETALRGQGGTARDGMDQAASLLVF